MKGIYLWQEQNAHLVFRDNITRPITGFGMIPALLFSSVDIWNFNHHANSLQWEMAQSVAKELGMRGTPINIKADKRGYSNSLDVFLQKDVADDAPLSPIIDRMLCYDSEAGEKAILGQFLKKYYPGLITQPPPEDFSHLFPHSSELIKKGFRHSQNVSNLRRLNHIVDELRTSQKIAVEVARDAYSVDRTPYKGAVAIYIK